MTRQEKRLHAMITSWALLGTALRTLNDALALDRLFEYNEINALQRSIADALMKAQDLKDGLARATEDVG
jgi:hypothetical protein